MFVVSRELRVRVKLTQALEPTDLEALREAAQRMRLELGIVNEFSCDV